MTKSRYYIESMRLRTLPLSVAGIIMGGMVAASEGFWNTGIFIWALLTALSLQILSNIANELGDLQKGTDNENRLGPIRSVQSGKLTPANLKGMLVAFICLSVFFGLFLIGTSFGSLSSSSSLIMIVLGGLAIVAAIKYTFGGKAYGYIGLGDLFVFLFFGLVSVLGIYFLMSKYLPRAVILPGSAIGFLSTAMLNQNNMRDIDNDTNFEKKTLAVRMGLNFSKRYHFILIMSAFILMILYSVIKNMTVFGYLYLLSLPVFVWHLNYVMKNDGKSLDRHMKVISIGTMLFSILGGMGLILG
ncbi:MAG: 1,4-dihydroxy-2-naphthoate octaprenyltransferase [Paludibacteraceae bacterium]